MSNKKISFNIKSLKVEDNNNITKKKSSLFRSKTLGAQFKSTKLLIFKNVSKQ